MTHPQIHALLHNATGLDLSAASVDAAVRRRMKQLRIGDEHAYLATAVRDEEELGALVDLVVVPESWFFRDAEAFAAASRFTAARIAEGKEPVRILSIPCASGEEPYSLAIALTDARIPARSFSIEAVDVSPQALRRAQRGVYNRNAFRSRDLSFRDRYFTPHGDGYELFPEIRKLVYFRRANLLLLDAPPGGLGFDIIFCRNLLIYFDAATQVAAIRKLRSLLKDDGLLFAGYAEAATFCLHEFAVAPFAKAFALQKKTAAEARERRPLAPPAGQPARQRPTRIKAARPVRPAARGHAPATPGQEQAPSNDPGALLEQANRLADQGADDEAIAAYQACLQVVPDSAQAYFMLGLLSEHRQDDRSAEQYLRRAVYLDPDHYDALCHLALLAERHGDADTARNFRHRAARVYRRQSEERAK